MQIHYSTTEQDFVSAAHLATRTRSKRSIFWIYGLTIFGVLLIGGSVVSAIAARTVAAAWAPFLWGSFVVCLPLLWSRQFRKQYRNNALLREPRSVEVDDSGWQFKSASSEGKIAWTAFTKFRENERVFVLFQQGNGIFVPIPKQDLVPGELEELRSLWNAHLGH
jgi:hypothetical protein